MSNAYTWLLSMITDRHARSECYNNRDFARRVRSIHDKNPLHTACSDSYYLHNNNCCFATSVEMLCLRHTVRLSLGPARCACHSTNYCLITRIRAPTPTPSTTLDIYLKHLLLTFRAALFLPRFPRTTGRRLGPCTSSCNPRHNIICPGQQRMFRRGQYHTCVTILRNIWQRLHINLRLIHGIELIRHTSSTPTASIGRDIVPILHRKHQVITRYRR
mmetsp:Transcript_22027/g.33635  ORF Transcript_22027/g.33635 Transcript_22027/m.33635 type:complete len:217 (-) Transcript_22027:561-1211(-)